MAGDLFSPSWYRVAQLKPRLRSHVRLHRHQYRGETWYVLQDLATDRFHRFAPPAYFVIGLMDGRRTVQQIWDAANAQLGDEAPTQQDVIRLISQLHAADALVCDIPPDTAEYSRRTQQEGQRAWKGRLLNVFSWRLPLFDPDRFLGRVLPVVRPLIGWTGGLLWLLIVGAGLIAGGIHWADLTHDFFDQVSAPRNLLLLWLLFPVLKLFHEMGHGVVTKAFGGEVHEMGVMLLVFTPVPYVEATAAWSIRDKWPRILVGAAGMVVELLLASLALFVWLNAEPGLVRMIAYNTILIAGVSTVLFNANPLLRFDGYYMLMDWVEIPNLKVRANRYFGYLTERYVLGQGDAERPVATTGERVWFVGYGVASSLYRVLIVVGILLFLGDILPMLALLFAALTAVTMIGLPIMRGLSFLFSSPRLQRVRLRAIATTVCLVFGLIAFFSMVPVPFHTLAEGVVWLPDEAYVRAGADGFVEQVVARPGARVQPGDVLVLCRNPDLTAQLRVAEARLKELQARRTEQEPTDRVKAAILEEEIGYAQQECDRIRYQVDRLVVRSRRAGMFVAPSAQDLPGRFLHQGDQLAHVLEMDALTVRAVVEQGDIDLVRHHLDHVEVRVAERLGVSLPAKLKTIVPAASSRLPSLALGSEGGGQVPMDPKDPDGRQSLKRLFEVELAVMTDVPLVNAGGRTHVRFTHERATLLAQWSRQIRQLFLSRFNV